MKKKQWKLQNHPTRTTKRSPDTDTCDRPTLRFSPTAWAKLLFFRDRGETEISGFGITKPDDLLYVIDFITIKQQASAVSISLDDEAVADFFESQVDAGRKPQEFFRLWLHTHPGDSAQPSSTDEETLKRVFGKCDWAVMCIIAEDSKTYARLCFNVGPAGQMLIPVQIDYDHPFGPCDQDNWEAVYKTNIQAVSWPGPLGGETLMDSALDDYSLPDDLVEQLEDMDPSERQAVLNELAARPDLWGEESEVAYYD